MSFQYEILLKRALIPSALQCEVFPERGGMESLYKLAWIKKFPYFLLREQIYVDILRGLQMLLPDFPDWSA